MIYGGKNVRVKLPIPFAVKLQFFAPFLSKKSRIQNAASLSKETSIVDSSSATRQELSIVAKSTLETTKQRETMSLCNPDVTGKSLPCFKQSYYCRLQFS